MASGSSFPLLDVLARHEVPFVVIGGHAVCTHGYVRATEDVDIVVRKSADVVERLFAALAEINAKWLGDEIDPQTGLERAIPVSPAYVRSTNLMMLITDLGFLDIFDFIPCFPQVPVDELFESAIKIDGRPFVSLDWLKKLKLASNRPQDRIDLENLP